MSKILTRLSHDNSYNDNNHHNNDLQTRGPPFPDLNTASKKKNKFKLF